jgi:hypothetical protein
MGIMLTWQQGGGFLTQDMDFLEDKPTGNGTF